MNCCVTIAVNERLVSVSDSRTNSGVDNVSNCSKMHAALRNLPPINLDETDA
jgi:predicted proteasome-type protease